MIVTIKFESGDRLIEVTNLEIDETVPAAMKGLGNTLVEVANAMFWALQAPCSKRTKKIEEKTNNN